MSLYARQNINVFSRDLKDPSESLSLPVLGKAFQVCGTEQRNARLAKSVRTNEWLGHLCILVVERRVRKLSPVV